MIPVADPGTGVVAVDLGAGVRAGFTVRTPAASTSPVTVAPEVADGVAGNLGLGVGDDAAAVLARRGGLSRWAGVPLAWATQVHGTDVLVHPEPRPDGSSSGEADGLVVGPGGGAAVVVADCVPLLLADAEAGVAAAVHAGRRGLVDGVVHSSVAAMVASGARPDHLRAVVGPAICGACYEVPAAMRDEVADVVPGVAARTDRGTPSLDLPAGVAAVLAGVGVASVHRTGWCTRTDPRFFSHRRSTASGEPAGRCAGVVAIPVRAGRVGPRWS